MTCVSLDQPLYTRLSIEEAADEVRQSSRNPNGPRVLFLDEIQYLADWERHLKVFVDTHPSVKCVVSGSAAAALRLKSIESGAGRFTDFLLPPLTFHEYLDLQGIEGLVKREEPEGRYTLNDIGELNRHFVDYVNFGGYPEAVSSPAIRSDPARYIGADIVEKVLLRDLPSLYGIQDVQELNALFMTLAYNTAGEVSLEELSQNSGVTKPTLKRYLEYLEAAFLIKIVHRIDHNARRFRRANHFKVYVTTPALRCALFGPVAEDSEPRRDDRAEAAGRDQEQVFGVGQCSIFLVAAVPNHSALAHLGPFAAPDTSPLVQPPVHVRAREALGRQMFAKLAGHDDRVVPRPDRVLAHVGPNFRRERFEDLLRIGRPFVHDLARGARCHDSDGRCAFRNPACGGQRLPRRALLVFGHAEAELAGVPEGRSVDSAEAHVEQVDEAEADRVPDHRSRPIAVAERVERAVHPECATHIAVDDDEDGAPGRSGREPALSLGGE